MKITMICPRCTNDDLKVDMRTHKVICKCGHVFKFTDCGYDIEKSQHEEYTEAMKEIQNTMQSDMRLDIGNYKYKIVSFEHSSNMNVKLDLIFEGEITNENN